MNAMIKDSMQVAVKCILEAASFGRLGPGGFPASDIAVHTAARTIVTCMAAVDRAAVDAIVAESDTLTVPYTDWNYVRLNADNIEELVYFALIHACRNYVRAEKEEANRAASRAANVAG